MFGGMNVNMDGNQSNPGTAGLTTKWRTNQNHQVRMVL